MASTLLIDTTVLIDYLRGYPKAVKYLEKEFRNNLVISSITVSELYAGIRNKNEEALLQDFLSVFSVISLDSEIAVIAGKLLNEYQKSHQIGLGDACIAASSITQQAQLITLNIKDFPMFSLQKPY